jgi:hypothetical protein
MAREEKGGQMQIVPYVAKDASGLDDDELDDDEIDQYLHSSEEAVMKAKLWDLMNAEPSRDGVKPKPKKRKKSSSASGASKETRAAISPERKLSSKINYSKLSKLFPDDDVEASRKGRDSDTQKCVHSSGTRRALTKEKKVRFK